MSLYTLYDIPCFSMISYDYISYRPLHLVSIISVPHYITLDDEITKVVGEKIKSWTFVYILPLKHIQLEPDTVHS